LIVAAIAIWSYRETLDRYWRADRLLKRFGFGLSVVGVFEATGQLN